MGSINYGRLNRNTTIGLGYNLKDFDSNNYDCIDSISEIYNIMHDELSEIIKINDYDANIKLCFKDGHYEGFYIMLDLNVSFFWNYIEKYETLKTLTKIKKLLVKYIRYGWLRVCRPGWCTSWNNQIDSIKEFNLFIKNLKNETINTPTEKNYDWRKFYA